MFILNPFHGFCQAFASVRAVNNARLVSSSVSSSIYISPRPSIQVWDGLGDNDVDYQNDLSSISGKVNPFIYKNLI